MVKKKPFTFHREPKPLLTANGQTVSPIIYQPPLADRQTSLPDPNKQLNEFFSRKLLRAEIDSLSDEAGPERANESDMIKTPGFWDFISKVMPNRDPAGLTLAEVTQLLDRYQSYNPNNSQETALISLVKPLIDKAIEPKPEANHVKDIVEVVSLIETMRNNQPQPPPQLDPNALVLNILDKMGIWDMMHRRSEPTQQNSLVQLKDGNQIALHDLLMLEDRRFDREQKRDDWLEKRENMRVTRENVPRAINAIEVLGTAVAGAVAERRGGGSPQPSRGNPRGADQRPPKARIDCPDCKTPNFVDAGAAVFKCAKCGGIFEIETPSPDKPTPNRED